MSGTVRVLLDAEGLTEEREISEEDIPGEITRFEDALIATRNQLDAIRQHVNKAIDERAAAIFDTHLLVLDDQAFLDRGTTPALQHQR